MRTNSRALHVVVMFCLPVCVCVYVCLCVCVCVHVWSEIKLSKERKHF
jgi:hypothetical protein